MEQTKQKQIEFRLSKIDINKFEINENDVKDGNAEFRTEVQFSYNTNQRLVRCRIIVNLLQQEATIVHSELDCLYEISETSVKELKQDDNIVIPVPILIQFASLCYGTMRGVMHTKTLGTPANRFILPPVYFHEIIKQDFVVKD